MWRMSFLLPRLLSPTSALLSAGPVSVCAVRILSDVQRRSMLANFRLRISTLVAGILKEDLAHDLERLGLF